MDVLGIIEIESIAEGYRSLDACVKASPVTVIKAEVVNPGKYLIMLTGDLASVEEALDAGIESAGDSVIDHILLPNLDSRVIPAVSSCVSPEDLDAIGLIETFSVAAAVEAADKAVKVSDVRIVEIVTGNESGGKAMLKICGSVGNVEAAVDAAANIAREKGQLCRDIIIPGPHRDIKGFVCGNK